MSQCLPEQLVLKICLWEESYVCALCVCDGVGNQDVILAMNVCVTSVQVRNFASRCAYFASVRIETTIIYTDLYWYV